MFRPQLRQALYYDRARTAVFTPARQLSVTRPLAADKSQSPAQSSGQNRRGPSSSSAGPQKNARGIDARSFAAPRAGGEPAKILQTARLRRGPAARKTGKPPAKGGVKGKKQQRARGPRRSEADEGDDFGASDIDKIEQEQVLQSRPRPTRYEPQDIDFSTLKETWPSLPTDANSRSAAVFEKLSSLSGRFANGYVPPYELGRRLWKGQSVLFFSEEEKAEALQETKRLAQLRADKLTQKKGEDVEPKEIDFAPIDAKTTNGLMETLAQGKYPTLDADKDQLPAISNVMRNLRSNGTYQSAGKQPQFVAKVESLLAGPKVKRT
ncbi:hypothetical protein N7510_005615 [Penicillium lagena]|uniref:uncharacterized protein n=1 Tax=Penicillium lagena TaxID=94218 RepID=UPI00253F77EB|nr:uncharacterized protein N7510_005615 [Penicillium lagena]KAJ5612421.1 hypothetical protein N7510_005615 [Penicillium lagena]